MKKVVSVRIEVDMDGNETLKWKDPNHFFQDEVENILTRLSKIIPRHKSKWSSEEGKTESGSKFKIIVRKTWRGHKSSR